MKILIYSFSRCGSSNLLDFLEQEFLNVNNKNPSVKTWFEPFGEYKRMNQFKKWYNINIKNKHENSQLYFKNTIVKTISGDLPIVKQTKKKSEKDRLIRRELVWYDQNFNFDKIIILYRENIQDRVESMYAQTQLVNNLEEYGVYHDQSYYLVNPMSETELNQRIEFERSQQNQIKEYRDDDNFLVISYEDLYLRNGLDKLKYFLERPEWYNLDMMNLKHRKRKLSADDPNITIIK